MDEDMLDEEFMASKDKLACDLTIVTINDTLKVIFVGMTCTSNTLGS